MTFLLNRKGSSKEVKSQHEMSRIATTNSVTTCNVDPGYDRPEGLEYDYAEAGAAYQELSGPYAPMD